MKCRTTNDVEEEFGVLNNEDVEGMEIYFELSLHGIICGASPLCVLCDLCGEFS